MSGDPSFLCFEHRPQARLRVFAIPFAGGSASAFFDWKNWFSEEVEVLAAQLPGRGSRAAEPLQTDIDVLTDELVNSMRRYMDLPYIVFGHSNGSLVAFHCLNKILEWRFPVPRLVVLSASRSPTLEVKKEYFSQLSHQEFFKMLKALNGIPEALLQNRDLFQFYEPVLRGDFKLGESFALEKMTLSPDIQSIRVHLLAAQQDDIPVADVFAWSNLFCSAVTKEFEGGHFYIDGNTEFKDYIVRLCEDTLTGIDSESQSEVATF